MKIWKRNIIQIYFKEVKITKTENSTVTETDTI